MWSKVYNHEKRKLVHRLGKIDLKDNNDVIIILKSCTRINSYLASWLFLKIINSQQEWIQLGFNEFPKRKKNICSTILQNYSYDRS